jgi:hypothetical protein
MYRAINEYANNLENFQTAIGAPDKDLHLVRFNGQWHRATIKKTYSDGSPTCWFLDLDNYQHVKLSDIMLMPKVFTSPSPFLQICEIDGFNAAPKEIKEAILDFVQENKFVEFDNISLKNGGNYLLHFNAINGESK